MLISCYFISLFPANIPPFSPDLLSLKAMPLTTAEVRDAEKTDFLSLHPVFFVWLNGNIPGLGSRWHSVAAGLWLLMPCHSSGRCFMACKGNVFLASTVASSPRPVELHPETVVGRYRWKEHCYVVLQPLTFTTVWDGAPCHLGSCLNVHMIWV